MKQEEDLIEIQDIIANLKSLTENESDMELANFLGVEKTTIIATQNGVKTELNNILAMLEYLLSLICSYDFDGFLEFQKSLNKNFR